MGHHFAHSLINLMCPTTQEGRCTTNLWVAKSVAKGDLRVMNKTIKMLKSFK